MRNGRSKLAVLAAMSLVLIAIAVTMILSLDWFQHRRVGKHHEAEL
jgi:hypothetical protein